MKIYLKTGEIIENVLRIVLLHELLEYTVSIQFAVVDGETRDNIEITARNISSVVGDY